MKQTKISTNIYMVIPILGLLLLTNQTSQAQNDSTTIPTLDQAIEQSVVNNGSIRSANLKLARLEALKESAYDIEKTTFGAQYGQFNSFENDYSFSMVQKFEFPTVYSANKSLSKANIKGGVLDKQRIENDLISEVKNTWFTIIYFQLLNQVLEEQKTMYRALLKATQVQYEVEEVSFLEKLSIEAEAELQKIELSNNLADFTLYKKRLQFLMNSANEVDISIDSASKKELALQLDSNVICNNPNLNVLQNLVEVKHKEQSLITAKMLPGFSIGYNNQSLIGNHTVNNATQFYGGSQRFTSVSATVSIPIWAKPDLAKIKAAKLAKERAASDAEYYEKVLTNEFELSMQAYFKHKSTVDFYEQKGLLQAALIFKNAQKSLDLGAINYIEFMNNYNQGIKLKKDYLTALRLLNESVIKIEFLVGNKTK